MFWSAIWPVAYQKAGFDAGAQLLRLLAWLDLGCEKMNVGMQLCTNMNPPNLLNILQA